MNGGPGPVVLLWDIDGTLLHGGEGAIAAWRAAVRAELACVIDWRALDTSGATDVAIAIQICAQVGKDGQAVAALLARYLDELPTHLQARPAVALPNVSAVLAHVDASPAFANLLLTGNLRRGAHAKLTSCGLGGFCWDGAFGECGPERNQVAAVARQLATATWGETAQLLVIGDTPRDIAAARFIGARVAAVASGSHSAESLARHEPDCVLPGLPAAADFSAAITQLVYSNHPPPPRSYRPESNRG